MDYSNLINKTVFDFCTDSTILNKIVPGLSVGVPKEAFVKQWKEDKSALGFAFLNLAEDTNNEALRAEVEKQFKDTFDSYFNE